jgi:hypothetical protein
MSTLFPRLPPTDRKFAPGKLPQTEIATESQRVFRKPMASKAYGATLELAFDNVSDDEAQLIQAVYAATRGTFDTLILPGEIFDGDSELLDFVTEIGGLWRFAEAPKIEWAKKGRCGVTVRLLSYKDSSRVVDVPTVPALPEPLPDDPEQAPEEGPAEPEGPEPNWGRGTDATFIATGWRTQDAYTTGGAVVSYETDFVSWGVQPRSDGPGYVYVAQGRRDPDGGDEVHFIWSTPTGTEERRVVFATAPHDRTNPSYLSAPLMKRNDGGYVCASYYDKRPPSNLPVVDIMVVDSDGSNPQVYTLEGPEQTGFDPVFGIDRILDWKQATDNTWFCLADYNGNIPCLLHLSSTFDVLSQWSFPRDEYGHGVFPKVLDYLDDGSGDMLIGGESTITETIEGSPTFVTRPHLMRVTQAGVTVWTNQYKAAVLPEDDETYTASSGNAIFYIVPGLDKAAMFFNLPGIYVPDGSIFNDLATLMIDTVTGEPVVDGPDFRIRLTAIPTRTYEPVFTTPVPGGFAVSWVIPEAPGG